MCANEPIRGVNGVVEAFLGTLDASEDTPCHLLEALSNNFDAITEDWHRKASHATVLIFTVGTVN